jgi:hypothetical protein
VLGFGVGNHEPDASVGPGVLPGISATEVDAPAAATVTQRVRSHPQVESLLEAEHVTKNSTALSWSLTGIPTVPMSVMVLWDMVISSRRYVPGIRLLLLVIHE